MRKLLVSFVALLALGGTALAAKTQASPSSYVATGATGHVYGRSDGLYQDTTSHGVVVLNNGTSGQLLGPTYYEDFTKWGGTGKGVSCLDFSDGSTCAGDATTVPGTLYFGDGLRLIQFPVVTATLPVTMASTGLDITGDLTDNDGFEIVGGVFGASGRPFIIGKDPAFYFCSTIKLPDVSGSDFLFSGFRIVAPMSATPTYTDFAAIGSVSGDIDLKTNLNNGGITTTDTTANWADGETHKLCVNVSSAGVVTYTEDGGTPATVAAFTFDDGDSVIPFIHLRHDADIAEATIVTKWEVGYTE